MFIDFPTILFLFAVISLLIWIVDAVFFQQQRELKAAAKNKDKVKNNHNDKDKGSIPWLVDFSQAFFPVIVLVLLLRSFVAEPFRIPSPSMVPTLLPGDFILVSKFAYGVRLPVINQKLFYNNSPKRGEVVVFRFPNEPTTNYIKRVIGVPGDVVEYKDKKITLNGKPLEQEYDGNYTDIGAGIRFNGNKEMIEKTINRKYTVMLSNYSPPPFSCLDSESKFTVKPGEYFVMGDNRDNSNDGRYWCGVPEKNLVGRAFATWMNYDPNLSKVRWNRMFNSIK